MKSKLMIAALLAASFTPAQADGKLAAKVDKLGERGTGRIGDRPRFTSIIEQLPLLWRHIG